MTIDKIKHYMDENIFDYWTALKNGSLPTELKREHLYTAKKRLEKEIETGILKGVKYEAELILINRFLG